MVCYNSRDEGDVRKVGKRFYEQQTRTIADGLLDVGLVEHLQADDLLGAVIRGHLYIEARLTQIIEHALPNPSYLRLERMEFTPKLNLAAATGWISKEMYGALSRLNKLRNDVVHTRNFEITAQDGRDFLNAILQIKGIDRQPVAPKYSSLFALENTSELDNLRKSIWWLYCTITGDALIARDWGQKDRHK